MCPVFCINSKMLQLLDKDQRMKLKFSDTNPASVQKCTNSPARQTAEDYSIRISCQWLRLHDDEATR